MLARPLRIGERLAVAAVAVMPQRGKPQDQAQPRALAALRPIPPRGFEERLRLVAAVRGQHQRRVLQWREARRLRDRLDLADQRGGGGEVPGVDVKRGEVVRHDREQAERAGVAREAHAAGGERLPELVVPEILREAARQPQPAAVVAAGVGPGEREQRLRERRDGRRVALGEPRHEGVQERVGGAGGVHARARPPRPRAHPGRRRGARQTSPTRSPRDRSRGPSRRRGARAAWPPRAAAEARRAHAGGRTRSARPAAPAARAGDRPAAQARRPQAVRGGRGVRDVELRLGRRERALDTSAGSGVSSAARSRNAAAAARPPRRCARSAEFAISLATDSSGVAVACARCQARRSESRTGSVESASARCTSRRSPGADAP